MKPTQFFMLAAIVLISPTISHAQVAGSTLLGVSVAELQEVVKGWSVKRRSLGNLFTTTTTNASDRSMTSSSLQTRRFRMPSSMPVAFSPWRSMMSPYPFLSSS
jgi:hypothetical protein